MNREEILNTIKSLSMSQGMYGRIYEKLTDGSIESEEALEAMEAQNFADAVDMVLWIEG